MSNNLEWKTAIKENTGGNLKKILVPREAFDHPLKPSVITVTDRKPRCIYGSQSSTGRSTPVLTPASIMEPLSVALEGLDPLTQFAIEKMDPLSQMAAEMTLEEASHKSRGKHKESAYSQLEPWSSRKNAILAKFTTSERLSIITSFLSEGEKIVVKAQSSAVDKVQHRLEQLDDFEEGSQRKIDLSQAEYVSRIEQLNKELVSAWHSEQRVKALKIAIQCAKLLADTDVLRFYPSKFVLITDILDIFGQLVYDRLRTKADYYKPGTKTPLALPEDFTPDMVSDSVKETCRNWFFKIASIRELVPRLFVEVAILKSYRFLSTSEFSEALLRITKMIRGIGNPLVAVYTRCYICRVGMNILTSNADKKYLVNNFTDFIDCYNHLFSRKVKQELIKQKMSVSAYMTLYTPALDFILQAVAVDASECLLSDLLELCRKNGNSSLILNTIMASFKPSYISERSLQLLEMIDKCPQEGLPKHLLLRTLGLCISIHPPPYEHRRQVLNVVWKNLGSLKDPEHYITCAEAWIQFVVQYFTVREVNVVLGDIIKHMLPDRAFEHHYPQLKIIIEKIIQHMQDFEMLLSMDNFLPLIDLFQQDLIKVEVCKSVLSSCSREHRTSDPVIINALMFLCGVLHDSVNALTVDDERRQIGEILCDIVRTVDYGRDFEQQLSYYVEARGAFSNIDMVLVQLVQCVNLLSVNTRQIVKGNHTKKTGDFVRACAAYCFITVPSISSITTRLELYLLSGRVALFNNCLGQADACFKAALTIIPEMQEEKSRNSEAFLVGYVNNFLSTLLVTPDNPESGVLTLTKSLLNVLQSYEWTPDGGVLTTIYLNVLDLLTSFAQDDYVYHIDKIESNDSLYGSDPKFIAELDKMCAVITGQILTQLKNLGPCRKQSSLATELFVRIASRGDLNDISMATLAVNLWNLSLKHGHGDVKYIIRTKDYLTKLSQTTQNEALRRLMQKLQIPQ